MIQFLQTNGIAILVGVHVLFIGLIFIRACEKKSNKIILDEHEEKFSDN